MQIGGGDEYVAMRHLSLYLEGSAHAWLNNLPEKCIYSWRELDHVFFKNFEGTYKRPGGVQDLMLCVQGHKESIWDYIQRWIQLRNSSRTFLSIRQSTLSGKA